MSNLIPLADAADEALVQVSTSALAERLKTISYEEQTPEVEGRRLVSGLGTELQVVSVLMATYYREKPERLARALESMFRQTVAPDELVLVVDGPIPADQEEVIARYEADPRIKVMRVVRLEQNQGLGPALNAGLALCRGDWIMRMDTDDESLPDRMEVQTDYLRRHPDIDVLGGWSEEFFDDSPVTRLKSSPISHHAIAAGLRWRNVMVHPSLLVRADALRSVQGYRGTFPLLEDWDLYIRLLLAQSRFGVVPKVVVRMLVGKDQAARRGGIPYLCHEMRFRTFLWNSGLLSTAHYTFSTLAYAMFRLVSPAMRNRLYNAVRISE